MSYMINIITKNKEGTVLIRFAFSYSKCLIRR